MVGTLGQIAITALIIIGIIAVLYAVTSVLGIAIPPIVMTLAWILGAIVLGILVIRYLMTLKRD